jgi:hypothetical protein
LSPTARIQYIRAAFPEEGFFQDKEWKLSPEPFPLTEAVVEEIERLGPALVAFLTACDALYLRSASGEEPALNWVAELLDQGKPAELIAHARQKALHGVLPRVIRPDLILTEEGLSIAEIDSVPGGMGLTAWLNAVYTELGYGVIGGAQGMVQGFAKAFPEHQLLVSTEAADYAPEMRWLAQQLPWKAEVWHPRDFPQLQPTAGTPIYRFFELFDLPEVECAADWLRVGQYSPPIKPYLEEKLWLALFHTPQLQDYWQQSLELTAHQLLKRCIPQGWVMHPQPLPADCVYPGLDVHHWSELKSYGRRARELVLKISGFSPLGWGSRGVHIGHDLSQADWSRALDDALAAFPHHPYILQRFHRAKVVTHPVWHDASALSLQKPSRVRLCPYYFRAAADSSLTLSGMLATVCPEDKKILHGMRDAVMLPCVSTH